jgi:type I restriction enzyme S subunit
MPSEWRTLRLSDTGRVVTGKTPSTANPDYFGGDIPFVTPTDMDGRRTIAETERYLTEAGADSVAGSRIPAGSVMVSCIGSDMGKAAIAGRDCVTNQQINSIVVSQRYVPLFVYYNLSVRKAELQNMAVGGSAVPILNKGHFAELPVEVPPRDVQLSIVRMLGALDDKIELNRKMSETLEQMARAIFKSWFVDFEPFRNKGMVDSPLGKIPKGWKVSAISDVVTRLGVGRKYDQNTVHSTGIVPVLDQSESGVIGYHDDEPGVAASPEEPVAVFANHTCNMRLVSFAFSAIQNVLPFTGNGVDTMWAYYATYGKQKFIEYKGHWPDFVLHKLVVPPSELTTEYSQMVRPFLRRTWSLVEENDTVTAIRDALLPKLMSGEVRTA